MYDKLFKSLNCVLESQQRKTAAVTAGRYVYLRQLRYTYMYMYMYMCTHMTVCFSKYMYILYVASYVHVQYTCM